MMLGIVQRLFNQRKNNKTFINSNTEYLQHLIQFSRLRHLSSIKSSDSSSDSHRDRTKRLSLSVSMVEIVSRKNKTRITSKPRLKKQHTESSGASSIPSTKYFNKRSQLEPDNPHRNHGTLLQPAENDLTIPNHTNTTTTTSNTHPYEHLYANENPEIINQRLLQLPDLSMDVSLQEKNNLLQHFIREKKDLNCRDHTGVREFIRNTIIQERANLTHQEKLNDLIIFLDYSSQLGIVMKDQSPEMKQMIKEIFMFRILIQIKFYSNDLPRNEWKMLLSQLVRLKDLHKASVKEKVHFLHLFKVIATVTSERLAKYSADFTNEIKEYYCNFMIELLPALYGERNEIQLFSKTDEKVTILPSYFICEQLYRFGEIERLTSEQLQLILKGMEREWNNMKLNRQTFIMLMIQNLALDDGVVPSSLLNMMMESFCKALPLLPFTGVKRGVAGMIALGYKWENMPETLRSSLLRSIYNIFTAQQIVDPHRIPVLLSLLASLEISGLPELEFEVISDDKAAMEQENDGMTVRADQQQQKDFSSPVSLSPERTVRVLEMIEKGLEQLQAFDVEEKFYNNSILFSLSKMQISWNLLSKETQTTLIYLLLNAMDILNEQGVCNTMYALALMCHNNPDCETDEFLQLHSFLLQQYFHILAENVAFTEKGLTNIAVYVEWLKTFPSFKLEKIIQSCGKLPQVKETKMPISSKSHLRYSKQLREKLVNMMLQGDVISKKKGNIFVLNEFQAFSSRVFPMDMAIIYSLSEKPTMNIDGKITKIAAFVEFDGRNEFHDHKISSPREISLGLPEKLKQYLYQHYYKGVPILRVINGKLFRTN